MRDKIEVTMPQMGESLSEGTVAKWLKREGEPVRRDEILLEISTDKVDSEIPSPVSGVLAKILIPEGQTVPVKTPIAIIETEVGEEAPARAVVTESPPRRAQVAEEVTVAPSVEATKFRYSPLAWRIAQSEGLPLEEFHRVVGTGISGRVMKRDVLAHFAKGPRKLEAPQVSRTAVPPTPLQLEVAYGGPVEIIPMNTMRRAIAEHMVRSVHTSAHASSIHEADLTRIVEFREKLKEEFEKREGFRLTYTPFIVDAVVKALQEFPMMNSAIEDDHIIVKKFINIGIAVALEGDRGLIVPVIKGADELNFIGLARAAHRLITKAREKKLTPDDVQGGTFTITNPGIFGNITGRPIINQPQVAILGTGAIRKRPIVINDAIAIRAMIYLSLSYDHRLIDGALAGRFLQRIVQLLESFEPSKAF